MTNLEYYLIGDYMNIPVYCNKEYKLVLGSRFIDFKKLPKVKQDLITASLGGMEGIELMINNYERSEKLEAKNGKKEKS